MHIVIVGAGVVGLSLARSALAQGYGVTGLASQAVNRGITDIEKLIAREPQLDAVPAGGAFELHRIGDAVTSRSVHSAIYDALRLASAL